MTNAPDFSLDNELSQTREWDGEEWDEETTGYADPDPSADTSRPFDSILRAVLSNATH